MKKTYTSPQVELIAMQSVWPLAASKTGNIGFDSDESDSEGNQNWGLGQEEMEEGEEGW